MDTNNTVQPPQHSNEVEYNIWRDDDMNAVCVGDLVVTFPMEQDQLNQVQAVKERYLKAKKEFEALDNSIKSVRGRRNRDALKQQIISLADWTPFEIQQIKSCEDSTFFIDSQANRLLDLLSIAGLGDLNGVKKEKLNGILRLRTLQDITSRDRTGRTLSHLANELRKMDPGDLYIEGHPPNIPKHAENGILYNVSLGKPLSNGKVKLLKLFIPDTYHYIVRIKAVLGGKSKTKIIKTSSLEVGQQKFAELFKQYTDMDFPPKTLPFEAKEGFYGDLSFYTPQKYKIPTFKSICINTLKEMFLINRQSTIPQILSLQSDLLQDFLDDCMQEQTPVGFEIANQIRMEMLKNPSQYGQEVVNELFPWDKWMHSIYQRDLWYYETLHAEIPQSIIHPPYHQDELILNVYDNLDMFKFSTVPEEHIILTAKKTVLPSDIGKQSIVGKEEFLTNFHTNTNNIFKNIKWDNIMVMGGIVSSSVIGQSEGYESSDIDVYFYGCTDSKHQIQRLQEFLSSIPDLDSYCMCSTTEHLILIKPYPHRHIQINCSEMFSSVEQLMLGVDIEASCFAYDGTNLYTMQRGVEAINTRTNIAHVLGHAARGPSYTRRLVKYMKRGFSVASIPNDKVQRMLTRPDKYPLTKKQSNIGLLYSARADPLILEEMEVENQENNLPFGPEWTDLETIKKYIQDRYDNYYDGYNSSTYPNVLDGVGDVENEFYASRVNIYTLDKHGFFTFSTKEEMEVNLNNDDDEYDDAYEDLYYYY